MEDVRQLSAQMALLERQGEALRQNIELLQAHLRELLVSKETIGNLRDAPDGQEFLCPIGGGCYVFANVSDHDKVIVNLGSNIAMDAEPDRALSVIDKRIEETNTLLSESSKAFSDVQQRMQDLDARGREIMQRSSAQQPRQPPKAQ
ncbi:MAG: prefoldin subunit alpha [Candidatus Methanofastidiosa archaeon]|nr:prefoldin subunit alpha [Candidatus Methanofastidiosa archaeon]MDD4281043.1 prefoldin subunit alpha [Candidatus Methanofastidiosa archaeon]